MLNYSPKPGTRQLQVKKGDDNTLYLIDAATQEIIKDVDSVTVSVSPLMGPKAEIQVTLTGWDNILIGEPIVEGQLINQQQIDAPYQHNSITVEAVVEDEKGMTIQ